MTRRLKGLAFLVGVTVVAAGCAAGAAVRQGDEAVRAGNLDEAVAAYRRAVQASPSNTSYRIALERTMLAASRAHLDKAREFEQKDQLDAAISEYRLAAEYDPSNRLASAKVAALDRMIRERIEKSRPTPAIQQLRERAPVPFATLMSDYGEPFAYERVEFYPHVGCVVAQSCNPLVHDG